MWIEERFGRATYENTIGSKAPFEQYDALLRDHSKLKADIEAEGLHDQEKFSARVV